LPRGRKKERILIDIDGVLRDYVASLNAVYQRVFPDHHIKPVTDWALEHFFPIGKGIYDFLESEHSREILENAPAYPGAIETLHKYESTYDIVIVTAQPAADRYPTLAWLGKHNVPTNEIHIEYEKQHINGFALLDDYAYNLEKFEQTGRLAVCMDRPWNQGWKGPRVDSVEAFFALLNAYLRENDVDSDVYLA
jgi:5'(3')-deoxyribonucleotidase